MSNNSNELKRLYLFFKEISERKLFPFAAASSFYLFLSIIPFAMLLCSILPYTGFTQEILLTNINRYFIPAAATVLDRIVITAFSSGSNTFKITLAITLFTASSSMRALMIGMDAAYNCKRHENYLIFLIRSIIYMVFLLAAVIFSLTVMVYGRKIVKLIRTYLPHIHISDDFVTGGRFIVSLVILVICFTILYTIMPAKKVNFFNQLHGAMFTACMWTLFSYVFAFYLEVSDTFGAYGFIGTILITLLWVDYCFLFLLIGGYINSLVN